MRRKWKLGMAALLALATLSSCMETGPQGEKGEDGAPGLNGSDGSSVLTGKGAPSPELGNDGDSYIDTDSFDSYVKSDGAWEKTGNIKGESGKSAYDLYVENYPGYTWGEKQWVSDLALGKLSVKVNFVENGGSEAEDKVYCKGEEVKIIETPSKENYSFTGWYLDEGTSVLAETSFIAKESLTLYAGYRRSSYSVTYYVDGTIYKVDTVDCGKGLEAYAAAPDKIGYRFDEWVSSDPSYELGSVLSSDLVLTASYEIDQLELPYIEISTENGAPIVSKEDYVNASISVKGTSNGEYDLTSLEGKIKGRGNSTWGQPKKPFKIKFDKKQSLFGSSYKAKSWVLLANYFDKSLSRNALAFEMSSRMSHIGFSSARQYVDVYLNGEYQGVYLLADQIETGNGRVDISEDEAMDGNTGYLLELDARREGTVNVDYFESNNWAFALKTPDPEDESYLNNREAYINYISDYMDQCFTAMTGNDWDAITSLMDVESFAETYLIQEIYANCDVGYSSFFLVKDKDGKLKAGPVWDFDIGAGNCNYNMGNSETCPSSSSLWGTTNTFYFNLLHHSEFKEMVTEYLYSYETMMNEVIDLADSNSDSGIYSLYKNALNRNFTKWGIMGQYVWPEPNDVVALTAVKDQLDFLHDWLSARLAYMKTQYPQSSGE